LWKNGQFLSWEAIEELYKFTFDMKFKSHNLTKAHIKLTAFSCMKVVYAVQVFSASVAKCLRKLKGHSEFKNHQMDELIKLIDLMDKFFDCMNTKEEDCHVHEKDKEMSETGESGLEEEEEKIKQARKKAYRREDDERFTFLTDEFLKFFEDWGNDVKSHVGSTKREKARMLFSHQTINALKITVHSFIGAVKYMHHIGAPKVNGRVFNQDPVEQYFAWLRSMVGSDNHLTKKQLLDARARHHVTGNIGVVSSKGNTQVEKRKLEVDNSPLIALKRRKT